MILTLGVDPTWSSPARLVDLGAEPPIPKCCFHTINSRRMTISCGVFYLRKNNFIALLGRGARR